MIERHCEDEATYLGVFSAETGELKAFKVDWCTGLSVWGHPEVLCVWPPIINEFHQSLEGYRALSMRSFEGVVKQLASEGVPLIPF